VALRKELLCSRFGRCTASRRWSSLPQAPRLERYAAWRTLTAAVAVASTRSGSAFSEDADAATRRPKKRISLAVALLFLFCSGGNKIVMRLLLVWLAPFTHLLGVVTNMFYIIAFGTMLGRNRAVSTDGSAIDTSICFARDVRSPGSWYLALAGCSEAVSFVLMPFFASRLPGSLLPVMAQGLLLYSMLFSSLLLGRTYDRWHTLGVVIVIGGVCLCSIGGALGSTTGGISVRLFDLVGLFNAYGFIALSLCLKELAFRKFTSQFGKSRTLRDEVVNLFTALWQCFGLFCLWPLNFALLTRQEPLAYFAVGWRALLSSWPLLVPYLIVNLTYTVVTTIALRRLSVVAILLVNVLNVPIVALIFCLELPVLGAAPFHWCFVTGLGVISSGLLLYNQRSLRDALREAGRHK